MTHNQEGGEWREVCMQNKQTNRPKSLAGAHSGPEAVINCLGGQEVGGDKLPIC